MRYLSKLILTALVIYASGCSTGKISGTVTDIANDSVTVIVSHQYRFKVDSVPAMGGTVTFNPTVIRKKFNSKKIHAKN